MTSWYKFVCPKEISTLPMSRNQNVVSILSLCCQYSISIVFVFWLLYNKCSLNMFSEFDKRSAQFASKWFSQQSRAVFLWQSKNLLWSKFGHLGDEDVVWYYKILTQNHHRDIWRERATVKIQMLFPISTLQQPRIWTDIVSAKVPDETNMRST